MPSVTFLLAVDVPDLTPEALLGDAEDIMDAAESAGLAPISCVPWARPSNPVAQPSGGFQSLTTPPTPPSL